MSRGVAETAQQRIVEHHVSRLLLLLPPWLALLPLAVAGWAVHRWWPAWWACAGLAAAAVALAALAMHVHHGRKMVGRVHVAATVAAAGAWLATVDLAGLGRGTWFAFTVGGGTLALSWNITSHARTGSAETMLSALFAGAAEAAGVGGAEIRVTGADPRRKVLRATVRGVPGHHTGEEIVKAAPHLESGLGLAPGSMSATQSRRQRADAQVVISDPRRIDKPLPWPGPSHPGESVAKPHRWGCWQDGAEVLAVPVGHHKVITGMSGAAKSTGAAWTILAELVTRTDVRVFGIDITKGDQTLGPAACCLTRWPTAPAHRFIREAADVGPALAWMRAQIKPRTDYLAGRGLQKWHEGCGMDYWVVLMEEAPDILEALGDNGIDQWVSSLKAARTAGIEFDWSGQRPDWTQMPTIARAQLAGRVSAGVMDGKDAGMCLSSRQDAAGCEPELWADREPGKAFLDGPWVADDRVPVPMRFFYWGENDAKIAAHCVKYARDDPAVPVPATPGPQPKEAPTMAHHSTGDGRPDPAAAAAEVLGPDDDPIEAATSFDLPADATDWRFADPTPAAAADPVDAAALLDRRLAEMRMRGQPTFRAADLVDVRAQTGMSRTWVYDQLKVRTARGQLTRNDGDHTWTINPAA